MSEHGYIQLTGNLSNSEGTTKSIFQTKNKCCWKSGDIKTLAMQSFHMWPVKSYVKCGRKNYLTK